MCWHMPIYAVAREPAGERANNGVGQGLRLAIGLRGVVRAAPVMPFSRYRLLPLCACVNGLNTDI